MIEIHDVALDAGERRLLSGIDARIEAGEFVALLGPNGVGKTTLLRAIAGLQRTARGKIAIDDAPVTALAPAQRALRVALVTSDDILFEALRVRDVVAIGRYAHHRWWQWQRRDDDDSSVNRALAAVGVEALCERLFWTLSSGERQRVWIALGLAQETPVLLLDEPTSHLDLRAAHEILGLLRTLAREGKTVVCAIHDVNDAAAYADRIALLGDGRLATIDRPDAVLSSGLLEIVYQISMERVRSSDGGIRVFAKTEV
jgi:iron complex transport system ATP-binding protein